MDEKSEFRILWLLIKCTLLSVYSIFKKQTNKQKTPAMQHQQGYNGATFVVLLI